MGAKNKTPSLLSDETQRHARDLENSFINKDISGMRVLWWLEQVLNILNINLIYQSRLINHQGHRECSFVLDGNHTTSANCWAASSLLYASAPFSLAYPTGSWLCGHRTGSWPQAAGKLCVYRSLMIALLLIRPLTDSVGGDVLYHHRSYIFCVLLGFFAFFHRDVVDLL